MAVVVTGACGYLGQAICRRLEADGRNVIATDHPAMVEVCAGSVPSTRYSALPIDLEDRRDRQSLIHHVSEKCPRLDALVNNAGITAAMSPPGFMTGLDDQTEEAFLRTMIVNCWAPFDLARGLRPSLEASEHGTVVNISSIYGSVAHRPDQYGQTSATTPFAYSTSKAALNQATRHLAIEFAPSIRVNAVALGGIVREQTEVFVQSYSRNVPLGRMAEVDDVSGLIAWLMSIEAAYVTGQVMTIDGGYSAW